MAKNKSNKPMTPKLEEASPKILLGAYSKYEDFEREKVKCRDCSVGMVFNQVICSDGCKNDPVVMVIGEAPGKDELAKGRPFVGKAGKLLRATLNEYGYRQSNTIISNILPCHPNDNKFPTDKNLVCNCVRKWLAEEIKLLQPEYILSLGNQPLRFILEEDGITKSRGKWKHIWPKGLPHLISCMPTYHPSYVLRKEYMSEGNEIKQQFRQDIEELAKKAGII